MAVLFKKILTCSVIAIVFYYILDGNAEESCCNCPYSPPNVPASEVQQTYSDLIVQVWNDPNVTKNLTCLGLQFRTKILEFLKCLGTPASNFAILTSYRFLRASSSIASKSNRCPIAKVINDSVNAGNGPNPFLEEALVSYTVNNKLSNDRNAILARYASGCDGKNCSNVSISPVPPPVSCYKDGFVYNIKGMWNQPKFAHSKFCDMKKLVMELYCSCDYVDNTLAIFATLSLNEMSQNAFNETNPNIVIESMTLYLSPPVQQCCCYQRLERIKELYIEYGKELDRTADVERQRTSNPTC